MAKSYYLDNAVLQAVLAAVPYTSPSAVYVALYTAAPGPTGGGTEVAGGSYQRTACTFGKPTNGALTNSGACTFPQASAGWGTITAFGVHTATSDFVKPRTFWQRMKAWLETAGKVGARFL
jgi:hypothetical protein